MELKDLSTWDWNRVYEKRPDLKKIPEPSLDSVIVEFLKQYEVYVRPASTGARNAAADAVMGGLMGGLGGPTAVGIDSGLRNQSKNAAVQEWTQWKQWALDHKDFPAFREKTQGKAKEHNSNIDALLTTEEVKKEIEQMFEIDQKEIDRREKQDMRFLTASLIIFAVVIGGLLLSIGFSPTETQQQRIDRSRGWE